MGGGRGRTARESRLCRFFRSSTGACRAWVQRPSLALLAAGSTVLDSVRNSRQPAEEPRPLTAPNPGSRGASPSRIFAISRDRVQFVFSAAGKVYSSSSLSKNLHLACNCSSLRPTQRKHLHSRILLLLRTFRHSRHLFSRSINLLRSHRPLRATPSPLYPNDGEPFLTFGFWRRPERKLSA